MSKIDVKSKKDDKQGQNNGNCQERFKEKCYVTFRAAIL